MTSRVAVLGLALCALLAPARSSAANWLDDGCGGGPYAGAKWALSRLPLEWTFGPACADPGVADSLDVIQGAWAKWEDVDCAYVSFEYIGLGTDFGLSAGGAGELGDRYNNVSWCNGCLGCAGPLGVSTFEVGGGGGSMAECDVLIEDCYDWTSDPRDAGPGGLMDAQAVAAHETGHCLGLGHSDLVASTMYEQSQPGMGQAELDFDDTTGLCCIYPLEDGCRRHEDCREGTYCNEGVCQLTEPGPQGLGWPCDDAADCTSGYCILWEGDSVCSEECDFTTPAIGCPASFVCRDIDCGTGACVRGALGETPVGEPCGDDTDCASDLCAEIEGARVCGTPCDPLNDRCDGHCEPLGDRCGVCVGGQPPASIGTPCTDPAECIYNLCVGVRPGDQRCSKRCGGKWGDCDPGWFCEDGICYLEGDGTLGSPCEDSQDCISGLCAADGTCTRFCDEDPCPDGFDCVERGGQSLCTPREGSLPYGSPCESNEDCASGLCADDPGCTRTCSDTAPCPPDTECDQDTGVCLGDSESGSSLDSGCGCRASAAAASADGLWLLAGSLLLALRRRPGST